MRSLHVRFVRFVGAVALALALAACATPSGSSVTSVSIDGGDRTVVVDDSLTFTATVVTEGGASDAVTWESSDESVAGIDDAGSVTILTVGVLDVSATSTVDPSVRDTVTLTVDPLGVLAWTRQFGTGANERAFGVATDANGHVFVAGRTTGALDGPNAGGTDAFIRSYTREGDLRWARQFGTSSADVATGVAIDANGNVYVVGNTAGALEGAGEGGLDVFIRSYDGDGERRWTRQFGTSSDDEALGVATDAHGNVYVTGITSGALEGDGFSGLDGFVRSFDGDGVVRWTRQFGTTSGDRAFGVATDANGNVYVAGETFGALEGTAAGGGDAFVRSYDGDGAHRWTRQFGTGSVDIARGVSTDASGNVYVTGFTEGALEGASFGPIDAFVRSFDGDGVVRWTRQFGTGSEDVALDVATDASGNVYVAGRTGGALDGASAGGIDAFVRSFDSGGTLRWTRQFGTVSSDHAVGVAAGSSAEVYVVGYTNGALEGTSAGGEDAYVRVYGR